MWNGLPEQWPHLPSLRSGLPTRGPLRSTSLWLPSVMLFFFVLSWPSLRCESLVNETRHCPRVEDCESFLPSERSGLNRFLRDLEKASLPPPGEFQGRGIVMSGGPFHVLQALANLRVLRDVWKSDLPGEFWHAFELTEAHCAALKDLNVECRTLRNPGVFSLFGAIIPATLMSSFRHVIWIDTDATLLTDPALLFETPEYKEFRAIFWPDHWGIRCNKFGQTAWPNHVAWELLEIPFNWTDRMFIQEHETSVFLVDKERHWKPLALANYMLGRDFFQYVLSGCKDAFRLAWLKLGAKMFLAPRRPALLGLDGIDGNFFGPEMVHFWHPGGPVESEAGVKQSVRTPLFLHQKKRPGPTLRHLLQFHLLPGGCPDMKIMQIIFKVGTPEMHVLQFSEAMPKTYEKMLQVNVAWNSGWASGRELLFSEPDITLQTLERSLAIDKHHSVTRSDLREVWEAELRLRAEPAAKDRQLPEGWQGWWKIVYESRDELARSYFFRSDGSVIGPPNHQGDYDGTGIGRLFKTDFRGFSHVLYGFHAEGKYELFRLVKRSASAEFELELELWAGPQLASRGQGRRMEGV